MTESCAIAVGLLIASSAIALALSSRPRAAVWAGALGAVGAAAIGVPAAIAAMTGAASSELALAWSPLRAVGVLSIGIDPLTAFFVAPLLVLGAVCGVYGASYLDPRRRLGVPAACFNLLVAAMVLVLLARNGIVLLAAWEVMTLASFVLITHDHEVEEVRRAGWIYLVAGHLGFACLLALFVLIGGDAFALNGMHGGATGAVVVVLALLGFGVKAGIVPLHVWLPEAHAAAPSHVSALMSGGMIKLGIYGILRTLTLVEPQRWIGPTLAALGIISAIAGISLAVYQRDLKRTLAYSSIENVGVILLGLGIGMWGVTSEHPAIAAFGLFGGLLHVWSHVVMKGLLFLGAGSVLHATGTRDVERHGGLLARMPRTGLLMMIGATAIAGLPPLAGFTGEWLVYLGLLEGGVHTSGEGLVMLLGVASLAMVGVLATLCFVRAIGLALLGQPRSPAAEHAHESGRGLLGPMLVLATGVVAMPFVAWLVIGIVAPVADQIAGAHLATDRVVGSLQTLAVVSGAVWIAFATGLVLLARRARRRRAEATWGCGYAAPSARMQYTSGSFSESAAVLLPRILRPQIAIRRDAGPFPAPGELSSDRRDPFTRAGYEPAFDRLDRRIARVRWVQQGLLHLYILFVVATVILGLAAVSLYDWWVR